MAATKPRIVYIELNSPASSSGVIHSTVLAEAAFLRSKGYECFFIGADVSPRKATEAESYILDTYGVPSKVYGCFTRKIRILSQILVIQKIFRLSKKVISDFRPTHIWTDSVSLYAMGRKIAKANDAISVYDVQAIKSEEVKLERGNGLKYMLSYFFEKRAFMKSDRLCGVSTKIKDWVHRLTGRDDLIVIPCCYDTNSFSFDAQARIQLRNEFGFADHDKVICYSGGLSIWQRIPDILKCCHDVSTMRHDVKFLFLTGQTAQLKKMVQETGIAQDRYIIKKCLLKEVPQHLSCADMGIILRHDIPVNNVASPIKIGEYLSCGLPVILTKGIGDYSKMVKDSGIGIVIDENIDPAKQIVDFIEHTNIDELREQALKLAHENISWDSHFYELERLFSLEP